MNTLYQKLEEHYADNGEYVTLKTRVRHKQPRRIHILPLTSHHSTSFLVANSYEKQTKAVICKAKMRIRRCSYVELRLKELLEEYDTQLPGLDQQALFDPDGNFIQSGDYAYLPEDCTAVGCQSFRLLARLESEDEPFYEKNSLN